MFYVDGVMNFSTCAHTLRGAVKAEILNPIRHVRKQSLKAGTGFAQGHSADLIFAPQCHCWASSALICDGRGGPPLPGCAGQTLGSVLYASLPTKPPTKQSRVPWCPPPLGLVRPAAPHSGQVCSGVTVTGLTRTTTEQWAKP